LSAGWQITDQSSKEATLTYFGPHSYSYDLTLAFPSETVASWTARDEALLLADLAAFYNDDALEFIITTREDVNGQLVIVVQVLGFSTMDSATTSYESVQANGIVLEDASFADVTAYASRPVSSCSMGFTADSSANCLDTDGCEGNTCNSTLGTCVDAVAPQNGYSCDCSAGYFDLNGTCANIDGCEENTCGSYGNCVDVAAPGVGFTCDCDAGYVSPDNVCVNEPGCDLDTEYTCNATDVDGLCADVAPPGTGYTCTCGTGYNVDLTTCTIVSCGQPPAATGYTIASGGTTYGSTRSVSCAAGYAGTAASITCQASGTWTTSSGCTITSCPTSPTQTGYVIASGASTYGLLHKYTNCFIFSGVLSFFSPFLCSFQLSTVHRIYICGVISQVRLARSLVQWGIRVQLAA
jgi:hypothetical protein